MDVNAMIETAEKLGPTPLPEPIASYEDETDPQVRGAWEIESQTSADWALARKAECDAEAEAVEAQYRAAVERLSARRDQLVAQAKRGATFFEFKLKVWAERNRKTLLKGERKSVSLLHGRVGWKKKGGLLRVIDTPEAKAELEAWLLAQGVESGLFRMTIEPALGEIQKRCKTTGEVPPGMRYESEYDDCYVKAEAPETALTRG